MLREEAQRGSALGLQAKEIMEKGELLPDDIMLGVVRQRLAAEDCASGFILDGFPRSVPQAEGLEGIVGGNGASVLALSLQVPFDEVVRRLGERRTCSRCGAMYHLTFEPPRAAGACNRCGGALYQREDDREAVIQARLAVYRRQTEPLLAFYRDRGALLEVDGTGASEDVFRALSQQIVSRQ
jgi:adenylate kinase